MSIAYTDGDCHIEVGPSRVEPGVILVLVVGQEPNEVCRAFRAAAYETGLTAGMDCPRPIVTDDGQWATLGRVW